MAWWSMVFPRCLPGEDGGEQHEAPTGRSIHVGATRLLGAQPDNGPAEPALLRSQSPSAMPALNTSHHQSELPDLFSVLLACFAMGSPVSSLGPGLPRVAGRVCPGPHLVDPMGCRPSAESSAGVPMNRTRTYQVGCRAVGHQGNVPGLGFFRLAAARCGSLPCIAVHRPGLPTRVRATSPKVALCNHRYVLSAALGAECDLGLLTNDHYGLLKAGGPVGSWLARKGEQPPWIVRDSLWERVEPLLPKVERRARHPGRKRLDDRKVLCGILFVLYTEIPWEFLPQELGFGSGMTCWRRLRDWHEAGVWERLHQALLPELHAAGQLDWSRAVIDSSHVRALKGGPKPGRARSTAHERARNTTSSPTATASRPPSA